MKSFLLTVWGIITLFSLIMGSVAFGSFIHKSRPCKIDPSQIQKMRDDARK